MKYQAQHGLTNLNYVRDHILHQIFKIILSILNNGEKIDNSSIRIYVNKTKNRFIFKIKTLYYLELWTRKTMKLLGSVENKITKNKNGENVPRLSHYN